MHRATAGSTEPRTAPTAHAFQEHRSSPLPPNVKIPECTHTDHLSVSNPTLRKHCFAAAITSLLSKHVHFQRHFFADSMLSSSLLSDGCPIFIRIGTPEPSKPSLQGSQLQFPSSQIATRTQGQPCGISRPPPRPTPPLPLKPKASPRRLAAIVPGHHHPHNPLHHHYPHVHSHQQQTITSIHTTIATTAKPAQRRRNAKQQQQQPPPAAPTTPPPP